MGFTDIHFINSLTGWRVAMGSIRKTTDGGLNWIQQTLPSINDTISSNGVNEISKLNKDGTIYAVGPSAFFFTRGLIFKTTDGGTNWGYQLPDTSKIKFFKYTHLSFIGTNIGWAYQQINGRIYTNTGGDTTIYTGSNIFHPKFQKISCFIKTIPIRLIKDNDPL
ncbi:MAG: hypothetical protein IPL53_16940 [Ignavibacteria bacterium]|nr:hypothetical protein [Ignavibacteria bacterium]